MSQKVVELYMATLKEYRTKLGKEKITLLMQVGEFFEIYGLIYPDGSREGNVWEFCDDVNLKVAAKPQVVYDRPEIQVFMGGVGESYVNPYIQKAVDRFGWTIVIFDQQRIGNSAKFERREASIISPGVNINSDNFSNISMVIYMEQTKNYYNPTSASTLGTSGNKIQIGVAFVDCLTGENGVMAISNTTSGDLSIALDELLKLLTIKNPNELNIYMENISTEQLADDDLANGLHLHNYNYKIHRARAATAGESVIDEKYHKLAYQNALLEKVYIRHRGLLDITQQLNLDGGEHTFSRLALILLIEFILKHDRTILDKLEMPEVLVSSDKYLMLANNALEQLDVLDNLRAEYKKFNNRMTLLDLLDNTKTPLGKTLLRQRLSIPITEAPILEARYCQIDELLGMHQNHLAAKQDKYGSQLYQIRAKLAPIRNIENYLRKIITGKIQPFELVGYLESLESTIVADEYMEQLTLTSAPDKTKAIRKLYPSPTARNEFQKLVALLKSSLQTGNLRAPVWSGVEANPFQKGISTSLDELQAEIDSDKGFLDNLILQLSRVIDAKWSPDSDKTLIFTGENATKGIHIYTNSTRKDVLEVFFAKRDAALKVGNYKITGRDIRFLKMKECKWEIEIPYLKTSNGTLKANLDRIGKLAKTEINNWLTEKITNQVGVLDALSCYARFVAEVDVLQSNTLAAVEMGYSRPTLDASTGNSYLKAGLIRHPIIEHIMQTSAYVPNDISLGANAEKGVGASVGDGILLFGVNAVGKSSLMKSLGLAVIMAQAGMYVAASAFQYRPFKYLFTRILGNDNLYAGLSSFEVEMKEFKVILKYANADSLLLCDEVCRGTVMEDGTALVASALEILSRRQVKFLSATHLHNLTAMDCIKKLDNVRFYHLLVERDPANPEKLIYTRKLQPGSGPSSYGILVAQSMNMDMEFIKRAQEIRTMIGNTQASMHTCITDAAIGASKYNRDKVVAMCEVCGGEKATDVHHINQQCDADSTDLLDSVEHGVFNKNKLWNLVALCKSCHQAVHSSPARLVIKGYIPTSSGVELGFGWIDLNEVLAKDASVSIDSNLNIMRDDKGGEKEEQEYVNAKIKEVNAMESKMEKNKKQTKDITPEIRKTILEMKSNNCTPRKIQFDLKRYWNLEISQQQIREIS